MTDFLPKDYQVPSSQDNYFKFIKGENRFLILSSPILGYEWWTEDEKGRHPQRVPMNTPIPLKDVEDPESIKHFWAMVVWSYEAKKVQILEITQKGIQKTLRALSSDKDWGSPVMTYDIVVTRTGDGMETKYETLPKPAKKIDEGIVKLYEDMKINLQALYSGDDPFSKQDDQVVDDAFEALKND